MIVTELQTESFGLVIHNARAMCPQTHFCLLDVVVQCNGPRIFHCRVWYRALSLRYACIGCSGIILIP